MAVIGGVRQKIHFFCLDLPHSDAGFVKAYPAERIEAFLDGHNAAFAFLGGPLPAREIPTLRPFSLTRTSRKSSFDPINWCDLGIG